MSLIIKIIAKALRGGFGGGGGGGGGGSSRGQQHYHDLRDKKTLTEVGGPRVGSAGDSAEPAKESAAPPLPEFTPVQRRTGRGGKRR